ncbi:HlyD family secretion protein [Herbaspirillum sp. LeCh32-8]|uniref:HlyD family secretion protein n=1 Tax=Herbaspirillum sp. LeCh32-8 TaxID=2821356 RepID=UPI001AEA116F|nr:HlyD family secretion protein [Herbaspirillum sp. LeCh32-8]MBP0598175.1 HlyD family secretion protein [Herbaspirillum sp. LeCh32-8]
MTTQSSIGASAQPAGAAPAARKKSALLKYAILAIAALAAVAWLAHWLAVGRYIESTDDAYVGGDITVIAPKVAGNIDQVLVKDNQPVRAGELLVKLDERDYQAALAKARAAVAAQEAAIANLEAERKLQESVIEQGRAGVAASVAETVRARDDQARYQSLSAKAAVSVQSAQKADADYKQAQANGQKAQAALNAAQRQLDVIATQKQRAAAALQQAQAEKNLAELNLAYTELRAPVDGVIGNRRARVGAYATVGAQLLSVVPAQGLWVDANFKESQIAHMQEGQAVIIKADVLPGEEFHGRVQSLAPATGAQFSVLPAENATGNFTKIVQRVPVRVALDAEAARLGKLRPGLSVTAEVDQRAGRS